MLSGCHRLALFSLIAVYAAGALENGDCDGYRVGLARTVAADIRCGHERQFNISGCPSGIARAGRMIPVCLSPAPILR